jgi:hypothetical protein
MENKLQIGLLMWGKEYGSHWNWNKKMIVSIRQYYIYIYQ